MRRLLEQRIDRLATSGNAGLLRGGRKGLEKEGLRVTSDGEIACTPHPAAWGAPLTHPYITTDYSEALPELITPPFAESAEAVGFLEDVHRFLFHHLPEDELIWAASMPCAVADDSAIPIADYGTSNVGRLKHVYRVGLDYRYGRRMQAIAGVHFNYSLPEAFWPAYQDEEDMAGPRQEFVNDCYFALIRNFKRLGWMVPFLFGNSPAVCKSFLAGRTTRFKPLTRGTFHLPFATSLRMSDIGYKNKNQAALMVSYDELDGYVASLRRAIRTPYPEYEAIGVRDGDDYIQLSTNVLQIENEYYSFIRPKRTTRPGERPTSALSERGVEYIEVRALDVNSACPAGVETDQLLFLEAFLIFCLLEESPSLSEQELQAIEYNELTIALRGRTPGLELIDGDGRRLVRSWVLEICDRMQCICEFLDSGSGSKHYTEALHRQVDAVRAPETLPSARILADLTDSGLPFHHYTMQQSLSHREHFTGTPPSAELAEKFERLACESHAAQAQLESADDLPFEEYVRQFLSG